MFLPMPCMHRLGSAIASTLKKLPTSGYTLVILGLRFFMSIRMLCQEKSPVTGSTEAAYSGSLGPCWMAEWYTMKDISGLLRAAFSTSLGLARWPRMRDWYEYPLCTEKILSPRFRDS